MKAKIKIIIIVWCSLHFINIASAQDTIFNKVEQLVKTAKIAENNNEYLKAVEIYTAAIKLSPSNAVLYDYRGIVYTKLMKYKKALNDFNLAIKLDPLYYEAYNHRGIVHYCLNEMENALYDYNKALELNPSFAKGYYNRAIVKLHMFDEENALIDIQRAAELNFPDAIKFLKEHVSDN